MSNNWLSSEAEAAKELFFLYDGSSFFMWKDDRDVEYKAYHVPAAVQATWLRELTELRLSQLWTADGRWSVHFLIHHSDFGHLPAVVEAAPTAGKPCDRRGYMAFAPEYWDRCARWDPSPRWTPEGSSYDVEVLADALRWISEQSKDLAASYRMRGQRDRLAKVIDEAAVRLEAMRAAAGRRDDTASAGRQPAARSSW